MLMCFECLQHSVSWYHDVSWPILEIYACKYSFKKMKIIFLYMHIYLLLSLLRVDVLVITSAPLQSTYISGRSFSQDGMTMRVSNYLLIGMILQVGAGKIVLGTSPWTMLTFLPWIHGGSGKWAPGRWLACLKRGPFSTEPWLCEEA